jgi:hypothetical protein
MARSPRFSRRQGACPSLKARIDGSGAAWRRRSSVRQSSGMLPIRRSSIAVQQAASSTFAAGEELSTNFRRLDQKFGRQEKRAYNHSCSSGTGGEPQPQRSSPVDVPEARFSAPSCSSDPSLLPSAAEPLKAGRAQSRPMGESLRDLTVPSLERLVMCAELELRRRKVRARSLPRELLGDPA